MRVLIAGLLLVGALCVSAVAQEKSQEGNKKIWSMENWGHFVMVKDPVVNQMCVDFRIRVGLIRESDVFVFEPAEAGKWVLIPGAGLPRITVDESELAPVFGLFGQLSKKIVQGLCRPGKDSDPVHLELVVNSKEDSEELARASQ